MLTSGDVLDLGPLGAKFVVKKTASDTGGEHFEMEWHLDPQSGGTPIHTHPHAAETYEVMEGQFDVYVDGEWRSVGPGETVTVEAGVPHTFRNATDEPVRVRDVHSPAMKFDEYFEGLHRLVTGGVIRSDKMTPKVILHMAVLMSSYPEEIRSIKPPGALISALGFIGTRLGYTAALDKA